MMNGLPAMEGIYEIKKRISRRDAKKLCSNKGLIAVQMSEPIDEQSLDHLEAELFSKRADVKFRIYGFYGKPCSLSILKRLPSLQHLSVDGLQRALDTDHISCLSQLKSLFIDIFDLDCFDFIGQLPETLTTFGIGRTKSRKFSVEKVCRFKELKELWLEGHTQGLDALSALSHLEKVSLRSISKLDAACLASLPKLWHLQIKLGSALDFSALEGNQSIKYLELWQIRGLTSLSFLSHMVGLQHLFLQNLKEITEIPSLEKLVKLKRVYLEKMPGLRDVEGLSKAPYLEELIHVSAQGMSPESYIPVLKNKSMKKMRVGFGHARRNKEFEALMRDYGVTKYNFSPFQYES